MIKHAPLLIALGSAALLACWGAFLMAQAPTSPSQPQAASGTITVLVNGKPIATGGTINIKSGNGVIASASPDPSINGADIQFDSDTAVMLTNQADQAGISRTLSASSTDGITYTARANPSLTTYTSGQSFVLVLNTPQLAGARLNVDQIGPVPLSGTCVQACFIIAAGTPGNPVSAFVVH